MGVCLDWRISKHPLSGYCRGDIHHWQRRWVGIIFGFSVVIGLLLVYGLLEDKKRHEIFEEYLNESEDKAMQKIILDKKLLQFNGHTFADVIAGLMLGLVVAILMDLFIL